MMMAYFLLVVLSIMPIHVLSSQTSDLPALTYEEAKSLTVSNDSSTSGFYFQQTMYRIKDPKESLKFYGQILGMSLLSKVDFAQMKFSLYFLGYENTDEIITGDVDSQIKWTLSKKGILELTHNWGTELQSNFAYHDGNSSPQGYGHIGIVVPDVDQACERFEKYGVKFIKKSNEGKMKGIAFIKDPDGYWIEILSSDLSIKKCGGE